MQVFEKLKLKTFEKLFSTGCIKALEAGFCNCHSNSRLTWCEACMRHCHLDVALKLSMKMNFS